jgi:hypothetical protein
LYLVWYKFSNVLEVFWNFNVPGENNINTGLNPARSCKGGGGGYRPLVMVWVQLLSVDQMHNHYMDLQAAMLDEPTKNPGKVQGPSKTIYYCNR